MAITKIRVTDDTGKVIGADGEDAEIIWKALTSASSLQHIRMGVQWDGPILKEIKE